MRIADGVIAENSAQPRDFADRPASYRLCVYFTLSNYNVYCGLGGKTGGRKTDPQFATDVYEPVVCVVFCIHGPSLRIRQPAGTGREMRITPHERLDSSARIKCNYARANERQR